MIHTFQGNKNLKQWKFFYLLNKGTFQRNHMRLKISVSLLCCLYKYDNKWYILLKEIKT